MPLKVSAHALSQAIRVPATRASRYFGNAPDFWMNVQAAYDLRAAEREASVMRSHNSEARYHWTSRR